MANLGRLKLEAGEPEAAESWFTAAAEKGHEGAMQQLIDLMAEGGHQDEANQWRARLEGGAEPI
ncbi:hypothetical protein ACGFNU_28385 [Spirillospora sp. NPDC048911]|uniref:hypothetical protein n=1 Tax=Spirillospora sp. NPDC048911 TaxID=3364527 RepID=UPI0037161CF0